VRFTVYNDAELVTVYNDAEIMLLLQE